MTLRFGSPGNSSELNVEGLLVLDYSVLRVMADMPEGLF
jgi:hypothetical protein